jgi:hypothetical protein
LGFNKIEEYTKIKEYMDDGSIAKFTEEEVRLLYYMVDVVENNPNEWAIETTKDYRLKFEWSPFAFSQVIDLICLGGTAGYALDFVFKVPIEEMPVHIDKEDPIGLLAKWRMKIGK